MKTLIKNGHVIDPANKIDKDLDILINNDRIENVGTKLSDPNAKVIDATGKFLIPGLWDFHVHLTYDDRFVETMPALFLSYGITSVRDTGGLMHKVLPAVEAMRAENVIAPRVFFAGPLLDGRFVANEFQLSPE